MRHVYPSLDGAQLSTNPGRIRPSRPFLISRSSAIVLATALIPALAFLPATSPNPIVSVTGSACLLLAPEPTHPVAAIRRTAAEKAPNRVNGLLLLDACEIVFVDLERAGRDRLEVERAFFDNGDLHSNLLVQRWSRHVPSQLVWSATAGLRLLDAGEIIFVDLKRAGSDRLEVERAFFDNRDFHCDLLMQAYAALVTSCAQQVVGPMTS
jgi:hypothetical protein